MENSEPAKQSKTATELEADPCGPAQRRRLPTKGSEGDRVWHSLEGPC